MGYGPWGIIDGWRRKKPEFWHTQKAYSPVRVLQTEVREFRPGQPLRIPVYNRFDHTNLNELEIRWSAAESTRSFPGPDIRPHEKGELRIPARDWEDGDAVRIQFFKAGRFVDEELIRLRGKEPGRRTLRSAAAELRVEEGEEGIRVSGEGFGYLISRRSGVIEEGRLDRQNILLNGPYSHLRWIKGQPAWNRYEFAETRPESWTLEKMDWLRRDRDVEFSLTGRMEKLRVQIRYLVSPDGTVATDYELLDMPAGSPAEIGICYELAAPAYIEWQRKGLWSTYPEDHIGRLSGLALLGSSPSMAYRDKPADEWGLDVWDFFIQGRARQEKIFERLSNDARSLKENITSYSVGFEDSPGRLIVQARTGQAARLKSVDGRRMRLIILTNWDYPDLGWGNQTRPFKFEENRTGRISIRLE